MLLFGRARGLAEPEGDGEPRLPELVPLALLALSERMRPDAATTVAYLHRSGVEVKIISGDGPATVAAVARAAGIETEGRVTTGAELPAEASALRQSALEQHRLRPRPAGAQAPARGGAAARRPARRAWSATASTTCRRSRSATSPWRSGSGSQLAKGVADVVLVNESFEAIPFAIEEGRKILRNVQRVAKLFVDQVGLRRRRSS